MKMTKTLAIALIAGGLSISSQASASNLDNLITRFVSTAVSQTVEDLNHSAKQSIANTLHSLGTENVKAKVEIKDIKKTDNTQKDDK
ncbi:hypothetical protein DRW07_09165 [Alteromonas sediminis]|uniref:Uncharacterized protein n=1 Tax=Alteromonas sediminis TaxID=2259342 RepID=A0A3N5XYM1_9ALTE|nr:hypothetical protein [Alteromonas sediminis]RPJ66257.1 hypothetical protein DRW07_09165 [Alteromonas sediminis]